MIKKEHIKQTLWAIVILTNIIFWSNIYLDIKLKAERLVYQVNEVIMKDSRINRERNKYIYADNQITILNLITGKKVSNIYSKDFTKVKPFKRFNCKNGENTMEYSRQDENIYYPEDAQLLHQIRVNIPILAILKTYVVKEQYIILNTTINDLPLPLNIKYLTYQHNCGVFADWNVKL